MSLPGWWWDWIESLKLQARDRLGAQRADKLLALLTSWSGVEDELGRPPTIAEYESQTHLHHARVVDYLSLFAETFPNYASPSELNHELARAAEGGIPTLFIDH